MSIFDNNDVDGGFFSASTTQQFLGGSTVKINSGSKPNYMSTVTDDDGNSFFVSSVQGNKATLTAAPLFATAGNNSKKKSSFWGF